MTKIYDCIFPAVAVLLIAVFMHVVRVQTVDLSLILPLVLLYIAGIVVGVIAGTISKQSFSY